MNIRDLLTRTLGHPGVLVLLVAWSVLGCPVPCVAADQLPPALAAAGAETRAEVLGNAFTQVTGAAISPLFVLSVIGFLDWVRSDPGATLPLHASPWFWGACTGLLLLFFAGSKVSAAALPWPFKQVPKSLELMEKNLTGLVAGGMLVPTVAGALHAAGIDFGSSPAAGATAGGFAAGTLVAATAAVFVVVRAVSLTVDAMMYLSPFALVDWVLALARTVLVSALLVAGWIHPLLGLAVSLVLVLACALVVGWCVRLNLFVFSCAWDVLTLRWKRARPHEGPMRAFSAGRPLGPPARTRGWVEADGDRITFRWRPWFVLPERRVALPGTRRVMVRGVIYGSVAREEGERRVDLLLLPPRYLAHHEVVGRRLGTPVVDGFVRRSIRQAIAFVKGVLFMGSRLAAPLPATSPEP